MALEPLVGQSRSEPQSLEQGLDLTGALLPGRGACVDRYLLFGPTMAGLLGAPRAVGRICGQFAGEDLGELLVSRLGLRLQHRCVQLPRPAGPVRVLGTAADQTGLFEHVEMEPNCRGVQADQRCQMRHVPRSFRRSQRVEESTA